MKPNLRLKIEKYIKENFTNAYQLSLKAGVSPASVSRFLTGKRTITYETAEKILKIIDKKTGN